MIKGLLLDLSGTIYMGNKAISRSCEAISRLREAMVPFQYITNTSRSTKESIYKKIRSFGIDVTLDEIFTAPSAIKDYLKDHALSPWLLTHRDIKSEFKDCENTNPKAVVLCDAADEFTYENLNKAFRLLQNGASLLAVGDNRYFKDGDEMSLDAGPFVRALEYASGKEAIILGKPSPAFFHAAASRLQCRPNEVLMVGDDVYSDVNGALRAGLKAALVQTGKYLKGDEQKICAPGACLCPDLYDVVDGVLNQ